MSEFDFPGGQGGSLRVIAWPAFANRAGNPYNRLLSEHLERLGVSVSEFTPARLLREHFDVWHIHWPDGAAVRSSLLRAAIGTAGVLALMERARRRGTRIVWTAHNLGSHERYHPRLEQIFWNGFSNRIDAYISLSESGIVAVESHFPSLRHVPGFVVPHGHYREVYPPSISKAEARRRKGLNPNGRVVACIGHIRPYKNVPHLVRIFRQTAGPDDVLVVAGKPQTAALRAEVQAAAEGDDRVVLDLRFLMDEQVRNVVCAADVVVLPYTEVLNSGAALLALSLDRPVLVPAMGAMAELRRFVGPDWVHTYAGDLTSDVLQRALAWSGASRDGKAPLDELSWEVLAARTRAVYTSVLARAGVLHLPRPR
jgi:beta-1,4-mannosyltransferase